MTLTAGERFARLRLARTDRVGPVAFRQLLQRFGSAEAAVEAWPHLMARAGREDDAALLDLEPYSELAAFASLIKPMADAKGVGIPAVAEMLSGGKRNELGVVSGPSLLGRIR